MPSSSPPRLGADLHVHTTHSDGACSPCEVVIAAANARLAALAITDHDTVSALEPARPEALRLGIELVPGVELTCELDGREVHLLGHFIDEAHPGLRAAMARLREGRSTRLEEMARALGKLGLSVPADILRRAFPRAIPGRRHVALFLVKSGQVASLREAFARFLADGMPGGVAKPRLEVHEAIGLVADARGTSALAHPPYDLRLEVLGRLKDAGLDAIETAGPGVSNRLGRRFAAWAQELELVPVAGSDFHAPDRPGRWVGAIRTGPPEFERLRQARRTPPAAALATAAPDGKLQ